MSGGLSISIVETQRVSNPIIKTKRSASIIDVNSNPKTDEQLDSSPDSHSGVKRKHFSLSTFAGLAVSTKTVLVEDLSQ